MAHALRASLKTSSSITPAHQTRLPPLLAWANSSLAWPITPPSNQAKPSLSPTTAANCAIPPTSPPNPSLRSLPTPPRSLTIRPNPPSRDPSINSDGSSFQLNFSEPISKDSLASFDTDQFKLFVDGVEQTAGSFSIDLTQFDSPTGDGTAPAANTPINNLTVQINGTTIETGQNVLLYAINDTNGSSGITDTSGNNLANFTYQLDNFSSQDYTAPEITEGNVDSDGSTINVNVSEFIGFDLGSGGTADPAAGDAGSMTSRPLVALLAIQVLLIRQPVNSTGTQTTSKLPSHSTSTGAISRLLTSH